jgi:hypothetical protein
MKIRLVGETCTVTREPDDRRFRDGGWGDAESQLLYQVKLKLNALGFDLIKKRMHRDGHLVDEQMQYLRSRVKRNPSIAIWNNRYQIESAATVFNREGRVELRVLRNIFVGKTNRAVPVAGTSA